MALMATVTREQKALSNWREAVNQASDPNADPVDTVLWLSQAGNELAAALASTPAEDVVPPSDTKMTRAELIAALAECYRLTGADPDSDEDWRLAQSAVDEVRRMRAEYDAAQRAEAEAIRALAEYRAQAPPAEDEARFTQAHVDEAVKPLFAEIDRLKSVIGRAAYGCAQAPPASDPPGLTVINEDDGDVTIDFDYANDRVVSMRIGEESSGLSALVDGESYALCPLDRVPPKVLALLRTEAKSVTLRQSDPPGLVALMVEWKRLRKAVDDADDGREGTPWSLIEECKAAYERVLAYPLPASPQAETKGDE